MVIHLPDSTQCTLPPLRTWLSLLDSFGRFERHHTSGYVRSISMHTVEWNDYSGNWRTNGMIGWLHQEVVQRERSKGGVIQRPSHWAIASLLKSEAFNDALLFVCVGVLVAVAIHAPIPLTGIPSFRHQRCWRPGFYSLPEDRRPSVILLQDRCSCACWALPVWLIVLVGPPGHL